MHHSPEDPFFQLGRVLGRLCVRAFVDGSFERARKLARLRSACFALWWARARHTRPVKGLGS